MITDREAQRLDSGALQLLKMYQKGEYGLVLHTVDDLSRTGPLSAGALGITALTCTALERYDDARTAASQALRQEPSWAWLHTVVAAVEAAAKQLDHALIAQQRAVQLMPTEVSYRATLAMYQRCAGHVQQAIRTASEALLIDPRHSSGLNELGLALLESGDTGKALEQFRMAQQIDDFHPAAYLNEGVLHLRCGSRTEARQCIRKALRRSPNCPEAENRFIDTLVGMQGPLRAFLGHIALLGRVTLVGWMMIAFLYYLAFRLLQFIWRLVPPFLPAGRFVLLATLLYLLGGLLLGKILRLTLRL